MLKIIRFNSLEKESLAGTLAILVTFAVAVYLNQPPPSLSYNEDE